MAATLIVEDGTGKANANTYISLADYGTYISDRGLTDTTSDEAKTGRIIQSTDWIETHEKLFQGTKNSDEQALVWPRAFIDVYEYPISNTEIPQQLIKAQAQLIYDSATTDLFNVGDGRSITNEKVDVLEVSYSDNGVTNLQPIFAKVNEFLKPLFKTVGGPGSVTRL